MPNAAATQRVIPFATAQDGTGSRHLSEQDASFLRNVFANSHINFLLGAGFCGGVLPVLGNREEWLTAACKRGNAAAESLLQYEFFRSIILPMATAQPTECMVEFGRQLKRLLAERGTTSIPRKASLFTTNYDSLAEDALEKAEVSYNDGFEGRNNPTFATRSFGRIHYAQSLAMEYQAQIPTVNIVKLHGSVTWSRDAESPHIGFRQCGEALRALESRHLDLLTEDELSVVEGIISGSAKEEKLDKLNEFIDEKGAEWATNMSLFLQDYQATLQLINPTKNKFEETVMGLTYYELLRLFANELDRNNSLLVSFGFSFADEHILEITRRALDNPQLILIICCHTGKDEDWYREKFREYDNVWYIVPEEKFELDALCSVLNEVR